MKENRSIVTQKILNSSKPRTRQKTENKCKDTVKQYILKVNTLIKKKNKKVNILSHSKIKQQAAEKGQAKIKRQPNDRNNYGKLPGYDLWWNNRKSGTLTQ